MRLSLSFVLALITLGAYANASDTIFSNTAYSWVGDSIVQGPYKAWATGPGEIISTYSAQPGYFMPVDTRWTLKNDITPYPRLKTSNLLQTAIYNMGLDEMVNNVEPDTTLRTGREWAGVWTRDVSYSIILSMAYLQPQAAMTSLRRKVNAEGQIIQDTGSGGAWPVSTDRMVWALAAWEIYKVTGSRQWLEYAYPIIKRSFERDEKTVYTSLNTPTDPNDPGAELYVMGETSFIDWREQSYPKWMSPAHIYNSRAFGTGVVHAAGLQILADMARQLGHKDVAEHAAALSQLITRTLNRKFWMSDKGYYAMYTYGENFQTLNPRAESLGLALSILYGIAPADKARTITASAPLTPFGAPVFWPQIPDMTPYHNNALWPFVASFWTLANARAHNEQGVLEGMSSVYRPAALFATNKENLVIENGDIATELNSSNMLWSLAGNIALTYRVLFGIDFTLKGIQFNPFVPKALAGTCVLENFRYRDAVLTIQVNGYGDSIASITLDGKKLKDALLPANTKGEHRVVINMACNDIEPVGVNHVPNAKAPLMPQAVWFDHEASRAVTGAPYMNTLRWQPVEYAAGYYVLRDGKTIARTDATEYPATVAGEYQVMAIDNQGLTSFATRPLSNQPQTIIEMPGENTEMTSPEVSYQPRSAMTGFHGDGWVEISHTSQPLTLTFNTTTGGLYSITAVYANGNGPVNTENKCAIRTIDVDGKKAGTMVFPHRGVGNWCDWGSTNPVQVYLSPGQHTLTISMLPENENMNLKTNHAIIDRVIIHPVATAD